MKPSYRIMVNDSDITSQITSRLMQLTLTDESKDNADQLDIILDDSDGQLAIPPRNAQIDIWLGQNDELVHKGSFTLDEVTHNGPPDQLTLRARSADFKGSLKQKREQSWHQTTLGNILDTIAQRNELNLEINDQLKNHSIEHLDQTNESDLNLLQRLGKRFDAIATVKHSRLLFTPKGAAKTVSGQTIQAIVITRSEGDKHSYSQTDRDTEYTGVQTSWDNKASAQRETYTAGAQGNVKKLRHTYANQEEAKTAAEKHWQNLQRQGAKLTLDLAVGNPRLYPETPAQMRGYKQDIDDTTWITERVTHSLNDSGYTCSVELATS